MILAIKSYSKLRGSRMDCSPITKNLSNPLQMQMLVNYLKLINNNEINFEFPRLRTLVAFESQFDLSSWQLVIAHSKTLSWRSSYSTCSSRCTRLGAGSCCPRPWISNRYHRSVVTVLAAYLNSIASQVYSWSNYQVLPIRALHTNLLVFNKTYWALKFRVILGIPWRWQSEWMDSCFATES